QKDFDVVRFAGIARKTHNIKIFLSAAGASPQTFIDPGLWFSILWGKLLTTRCLAGNFSQRIHDQFFLCLDKARWSRYTLFMSSMTQHVEALQSLLARKGASGHP
ncbi:MAG TPA: hypothetical protein VN729_13610, partial [Ktedonobacteraceae bacterium]|nr:hypothetical protein [Ktedonobacteraceae bacterium]